MFCQEFCARSESKLKERDWQFSCSLVPYTCNTQLSVAVTFTENPVLQICIDNTVWTHVSPQGVSSPYMICSIKTFHLVQVHHIILGSLYCCILEPSSLLWTNLQSVTLHRSVIVHFVIFMVCEQCNFFFLDNYKVS